MILKNGNKILKSGSRVLKNTGAPLSPIFAGLLCALNFEGNAKDSFRLVTGTESGSPVYAAAQNGQGITYPSLAYLDMPVLSGMPAAGNFTIACWVRLSSLGSFQDICGFGTESANRAVFFFINTTNKVCCDPYGTPGTASTTSLAVDTWYFVGVTCISQTLQIYINGVADGPTSVESFNIGSTYFTPGRAYSGSGGRFHNNLKCDTMYIWNRGLSALEMSNLYNGGSNLIYN